MSLSDKLPTEMGWADPASRPTTEAARRVVDGVVAVPLVGGGVQLELHAGGCELEIEVTPEGVVQSVFWEAAGASDERGPLT